MTTRCASMYVPMPESGNAWDLFPGFGIVQNSHLFDAMISIIFFLVIIPVHSFYIGYGFHFYNKRSLSSAKNEFIDDKNENSKKLELIVDFVIDALPNIVASCYAHNLKSSDINLNSPLWRKESTLNYIHEQNPDSSWARSDLIDAYWKLHYPSIISKMKILLVDNKQIFISYPNDFDSVMGATEINPITFVEQMKDKFDEVIKEQEKVVPDEESGYFPKKATFQSDSWKETVQDEMKARDKASSSLSSTSASPRQRQTRPKSTLDSGYHPEKVIEPLSTDWDFKPATFRNLKKKLKSRKKYFK